MCFDIYWFEQVLIWLVVIGVIVAIVRLLLPQVLAQLGGPGWPGAMTMQIISIVVWGAVMIAVIIFAFELIGCLFGGAMRFPHR